MLEGAERDQELADMAGLPEHEWRLAVASSLRNLKKDMNDNTDICADTQANVNEKLEGIEGILLTAKGGLKFMGWLGFGIKWLGAIGLGFAGIIAGVKAGESVWEVLSHLYFGGKK